MSKPAPMQELKDALLKAACNHGRDIPELKGIAGLKSMSRGYAHYLLEEMVAEGFMRHATDETSKFKARYRLTGAGLDYKSQLVIYETSREVADAE